LIALTTAARLATPSFAPALKVIVPVVTPLMVRVPDPAANVCAVPTTVLVLTVAVTPVCEETALIAAAFAIALADWLAEEDESDELEDGPTDTPLMVISPAPIAVPLLIAVKEEALVLPSCVVSALSIETLIDSLALAPTWNEALLKVPFNNFTPLNSVVVDTRLISETS